LIERYSVLFYYFFFFQAEDGIRDDLVTGVQTCALPICLQSAIAGNAHTEAYEKIYQSGAVGVSIDDFVAEVQRRFSGATSGLKRSEERRVGKECGSRGGGGADRETESVSGR